MPTKTLAATRKGRMLEACSGACADQIIERLGSVEAKLATLNRVLDNLVKGKLDWGHAGTLGMVDARLGDLLSSFSDSLKV